VKVQGRLRPKARAVRMVYDAQVEPKPGFELHR